VLPVLDEQLGRLPQTYRAAVVLCDLEGKTRREAARQLGCPEGTVASRLARARAMLAKRLALRGVVLSGGALAAVLSQHAASAGVPPAVVSSTIRAASLLAAGRAAAGLVSVKAAALTEGVVKAMFMSKLKGATTILLVLSLPLLGVGLWTTHSAVAQQATRPSQAKVKEPSRPPAPPPLRRTEEQARASGPSSHPPRR
jgi:hypothetical protein